MKGTLYTIFCLFTISSYAQKIHTSSLQNWVSSWQDSLQETYTYNSKGVLINKMEQRWNAFNHTWVNNRQDSYTLNNDSTLQQHSTQLWDASHHVWQNSVMVTDSFSAHFRLIASLTQNWIDGRWQNSTWKVYTNNRKGYLIKQVDKKWNGGGNVWINAERWKFTNNKKGAPTAWIGQGWDTLHHSWTKNRESRNSMTYNDSSKLLGNVDQIYLNHHWQDNVRSINAYDAKGYQTSSVGQVWDAASNTWIETWHRDFTNNTDGTVNYYISERWKKQDDNPVSKYKLSFTY